MSNIEKTAQILAHAVAGGVRIGYHIAPRTITTADIDQQDLAQLARDYLDTQELVGENALFLAQGELLQKCRDGKWRTDIEMFQNLGSKEWHYKQEGWDSPLAAYHALKLETENENATS